MQLRMLHAKPGQVIFELNVEEYHTVLWTNALHIQARQGRLIICWCRIVWTPIMEGLLLLLVRPFQ